MLFVCAKCRIHVLYVLIAYYIIYIYIVMFTTLESQVAQNNRPYTLKNTYLHEVFMYTYL